MRRLVGSACVAVALAGSASFGCESRGRAPGGANATNAAADAPELAPLPAPDGVLFEVAVHDPDAIESRVQRGAGGAFALLPPTVGALACGLLGIDASLGALVDGHATAYGLVARRSGAQRDLGWALALRLTDDGARRAAGPSFDDGAPGWAEHVEGALRVLTRPDRPLPVALAVVPGWLVVARDEAALVAMAPYVYRTMPTEEALGGPALVAVAPHAALAGSVVPYLASQWADARAWLLERDRTERARHGGRAPDFGDPEALVGALGPAIDRRLASLSTASEVRVEVDAGDDDVVVEARVTPGAPAALAGAPPPLGDAGPLTGVPAAALLALLVRDAPEARAEDARDLTALLARFLGSRLRDDRARAIGAALGGWAAARGDWMSVAIAGSGAGAGAGSGAGSGSGAGAGAGSGSGAGPRALWIRAPAARDEAVLRAVREVLDVARLPPLRALSGDLFPPGPVVFAPGPGNARIATFEPSKPVGAAGAEVRAGAGAGVAWSVAGGDVTIAAGPAPLALLAEGTSAAATWGEDARTARALSAVGDSASFVALARPMGFGDQVAAATGTAGPGGTAALEGARAGGRGARGAPVVVAWGRRGGDPWARIDLADELLTEGVRLGASLF